MKPPEVEAANNQWRSEVDQLGRFIEERCVVAEFGDAGGGHVHRVALRPPGRDPGGPALIK